MHDVGTLNASVAPTIGTRRGKLDMEFARDPYGRTFLRNQFSSYPFHICRPLYLDDGPTKNMATIYTQSCSGGLYTEDRLETSIVAGPETQVHVSTQASTIIHQGTRGPACQSTTIKVADDALMEYTPDPVILFPNSHLRSSLRLELTSTASAIVHDSFLAHDYRSGSGTFDLIENELTIVGSNGISRMIDRFRFSGSEYVEGITGQMGGYLCHGSFVAIAPKADVGGLVAVSREAIRSIQNTLLGVSILPDGTGMSARILSRNAVGLKVAMTRLWSISREAITGSPPQFRRK